MKSFYGSLFGWTYEDYGPEYAAVHGAGLEAGFHAGSEGRPSAPLAIIETDRLEDMEQTRASGRRHHHASHLCLPRRPPLSLHRS